MEPDRYQQNKAVYLIGLGCLITSLLLFGACIYTFPYVAFGWSSNIPHPIFDVFVEFFQNTYGMDARKATWLFWWIMVFFAIILAFITNTTSHQLDNQVLAKELEEDEVATEQKTRKKVEEHSETVRFSLTIFLIIVFIFLVAKMFQWVISTN